jgi:hypothetical protein
MNELIMPHNAGVKRALDSMKVVTAGRFFCYMPHSLYLEHITKEPSRRYMRRFRDSGCSTG